MWSDLLYYLLQILLYVLDSHCVVFVQEKDLSIVKARDGRYDGVMHLVTAADGAADHYTLANNDARSEGLSAAIEVDKNVQEVWRGSPNHYIL